MTCSICKEEGHNKRSCKKITTPVSVPKNEAESIMALPKYCTGVFTTNTLHEFLRHPNRMGHSNKIHIYHKGDIIICYNLSSNRVFGIAKFINIDNDKVYKKTEIEPGEQIPYTDVKYNDYEIGVQFYPIEPVSVETINIECNIEPRTQLNKILYKSFNGDNPQIAPWANRILSEINE